MWINDAETRTLAIHAERTEHYLFFHYGKLDDVKRKEREEHRKWAIIKVGKKERLVFVHRETMKAYKADNYERTWMEIKSFTFIRWARPMDL
jgi:CRISPR/Cas system-associated protein Cas5 (RAMP superfamily)